MLYHLLLLLPCTVCLFGATWLLCKKKSNTRAQNILILCFLLSGVFFFCTANYIGGISDYVTYRRLDILDCLVTPFTIPMMYLYFRSLTYEGQFTWKEYIWFLPAFIIGISTLALYWAMEETQAADYIQTVLIDKSPSSMYEAPIYKLHYFITIELYTYFALIQIIGTVLCTVFYLRRYHHRLREFHSTLDNDSIRLDYTILFWFVLIIPFALGIILTEESYWGKHQVITSFYFAGYTAAYFGIWHYGSQERYTVENFASELQQADLEAIRNHNDSPMEENDNESDEFTEGGCSSKYAKYLDSFNQLIAEEQVFLQCSIRADEMANRMHTNRTYLSRMIKEEFQCTFSDYINRKRIEYAQQLMRENPTIKSADLAVQSGFSEVSSFGRIFKQTTGLPPKEWLKKELSSL